MNSATNEEGRKECKEQRGEKKRFEMHAHECLSTRALTFYFFFSIFDRFLVFGSAFVVRLLFFCVLSCAFEDNDVNTDNSGYCHHSNFHESSSFLHWQKNCTNEPNVKWFFNSIFQAIFSLYRAFNDTVVKKDVPRCLLWK